MATYLPGDVKLATAMRAVQTLLERVDPNPHREGLRETPLRVVKAFDEWFSGYGTDPSNILKSFEDGAEGCNEMVVMTDIPVQSHCEHHIAPFVGTATVGYLPDGRIVGLSKLPRVVNIYAKRLQVQERLTNQIADAILTNLKPKGVGVIIRCEHFCMATRGVHAPGVWTTTSALRGVFLLPEVRAEFLALHQKGR